MWNIIVSKEENKLNTIVYDLNNPLLIIHNIIEELRILSNAAKLPKSH